MAKPLSEQIKAAMGPDARVTTVGTLIFDVRRAVAEAAAERDGHHAIAVSTQSDDATADAAADAEIKAARKHARLSAQLVEVEARHGELEREAAAKKAAAERAEIIAERDQLVADLKERWPVLVGEMLELIDRVVANEPRCKARGELGPEAIARDLGHNFHGPAGLVPRIIEMDLVGLDKSGHLLRQGNKYWGMGAWS